MYIFCDSDIMNNQGSALHALLIDLNCPFVGGLTPDGLDWMFEVQGCDTFLHWIVDNLGAENVVNDQDIAAFSKLPSDKLLRGPILDAALSCLGVDSEMSEHQLECQIAQLEEEIFGGPLSTGTHASELWLVATEGLEWRCWSRAPQRS